jgi:hypothetical protein
MSNKYIICKTDSDGNETYFSEFNGTGGENSKIEPYFCHISFKKVQCDDCCRCSNYNEIKIFDSFHEVKEVSKLLKENFYKDIETTISIICVEDFEVEFSKLGTLLVV